VGLISDVSEHHPMHAYLRAQREAAAEPIVPTFFPFEETTKFALGCDLGQASDPTALCIVQYRKGILDSRNSFQRAHEPIGGVGQVEVERLDVRFLERLPLGLSYPRIVQRVAEIMARPPLCDDKHTRLIIDQTGVGAPVGDLFADAGMKPVRCTITGASVADVHWVGKDRFHVSKMHLVSLVDAGLHSGTLRFAAQLSESETMKNELLDFRRKLSESGRSSYAARATRHDDLVMALSLAVWWLSQPPLMPKAVLGGY
jgi:hypothetical protein